MTFERTFDYELVREIITNPAIYPHVSDDGSPPAKDFRAIESEVVWYVLVKDGKELLGCFTFVPQNAVCYEVHTCLLPVSWGERAKEAAKGVKEWMFRHSPAMRIVTVVPENNSLALHFAKSAGMETFGVNPQSFMKGGHLYDQILLGVSKCQ